MDEPLPTSGAPPDELLELANLVRRELLLREESPSGEWVEATATDLRGGEKTGFYYPLATGGGLAFRSDRGPDSFAHVHVERNGDPAERAVRLANALLASLPATTRSISIGFTGLTAGEEPRVLERVGERPGSAIIRRFAMERALEARDGAPLPSPPDGLRHVPLREVTLDALADLDWRAFEGTVDALLIGSDLAEYRRVLEALMAGEAGRFLDEASTALYRAEPPALLGAILTCEKSPRRAVFLDFMVDPVARRKGYGRYLLRWGFRALRALGYERVRLWVSESNTAARRLYDSVGFSVTLGTTIYRWDRPAASAQPHSAT
jgi:ribosomal protein S18 acetylase RimI-like enzyme